MGHMFFLNINSMSKSGKISTMPIIQLVSMEHLHFLIQLIKAKVYLFYSRWLRNPTKEAMALPPLLPACTQWSPHTRCAGIFGGRLEGGVFGGCIVKHIEDVLVRTDSDNCL